MNKNETPDETFFLAEHATDNEVIEYFQKRIQKAKLRSHTTDGFMPPLAMTIIAEPYWVIKQLLDVAIGKKCP